VLLWRRAGKKAGYSGRLGRWKYRRYTIYQVSIEDTSTTLFQVSMTKAVNNNKHDATGSIGLR
jgi:hypothetical protein